MTHYKSLHTWNEKRKFAADMSLDPELSFLQAVETEGAEKTAAASTVSGPMYLWDVARANCISYDPTKPELLQFLMGLVRDCETVEADDIHLHNEGHVRYVYNKHLGQTGKVKGTRKMELTKSTMRMSSSSSLQRWLRASTEI